MPELDCHASRETPPATPADDSPKARARTLILKTLGFKRVAAWCGVEGDTVYQWLSRGTDAEPIPPARVAAIVSGAKAEGLDAPIDILWPAMAEASQ